MTTKNRWLLPVTLFCVALCPGVSCAQSFSSSGQDWSGSWGFPSATDRSIALQRAQVLRQVENPAAQPETVYSNYYDNRSNYVETNVGEGDVTTDFQIGDVIGENTYAVGSLNTGNTTIAVDGDSNVIDSINSADTRGCVDGSIRSATAPTSEVARVFPTPYLPVVRSCE